MLFSPSKFRQDSMHRNPMVFCHQHALTKGRKDYDVTISSYSWELIHAECVPSALSGTVRASTVGYFRKRSESEAENNRLNFARFCYSAALKYPMRVSRKKEREEEKIKQSKIQNAPGLMISER